MRAAPYQFGYLGRRFKIEMVKLVYFVSVLALFLPGIVCEGDIDTQNALELGDEARIPKINYESDIGLNVTQLIRKYGYPLELHDVTTEDGYILQVHRIPHGLTTKGSVNTKKPIVLLIHCFLCSSAEWIYMGPGKSLGYVLADSGYDVWIGNNRGNTWSRRHVELDPDENSGVFWDYSFHEMGYYDLPAMIDHILNATGEEKLYIIGHSQGTVSTLVMLTARPEYNKKVKLFTAYSPAPNIKLSTLVRTISYGFWPVGGPVMRFLGMKELMPRGYLLPALGRNMCRDDTYTQYMCLEFLYQATGRHPEQFNKSTIPVIVTSTPAGSSWKTVEHFAQIIHANTFQQYDYGESVNLRRYGTPQPPPYDFKNVQAPVAIYYGQGDTFVDPEGVLKLAKELPNVALLYDIPDPKWTHLDFLWAIDAPKILYKKTIEVMEKYIND